MKKYVICGVAGLYMFSAINSMHAMLTRSAQRLGTVGQKRGYSSWFSYHRQTERKLKEAKIIEAEEAIRKEYKKVGLWYRPPVIEFSKNEIKNVVPINPLEPQPNNLMTRLSLGWQNFKGFIIDLFQTQKMRDAKKKAASEAQTEHMEEINKSIAEAEQAELALEKAKRDQLWTKQLEDANKERIATIRKEAEIQRKKERDELIRKRAQEIEKKK